jgi:hypothetical protein
MKARFQIDVTCSPEEAMVQLQGHIEHTLPFTAETTLVLERSEDQLEMARETCRFLQAMNPDARYSPATQEQTHRLFVTVTGIRQMPDTDRMLRLWAQGFGWRGVFRGVSLDGLPDPTTGA